MSMPSSGKVGVVLMTYGSATVAEHTADYFHRIYGDNASPEVIADFENRYRTVGGSPLVEITKRQAALLEEKLGEDFVVRAGMRHSEPFIKEAVSECVSAGAASLVGIILSPQFSSFIMDGYTKDFSEAAGAHGIPRATVAGPWPSEEHFVKLLALRTKEALENIEKGTGARPPVVFTTHSLPKRVVNKDPQYLKQLEQTTSAVRALLPPDLKCYSGYQSAGHTPEEWLKPDLTDILEELSARGHTSVLIVPIQFLADHLEILYDLDVAGRKQCEERGIAYNRIELPNTAPLFIEALASVAGDILQA